jgi:hypothetical protein
MLSRVSYAMGMLGGASDHVVVVYDKRSIRGLDPLSGQLLWERRVNKPNVMAYLDGSRLYLYAANDPPALIDAYSGQIRKQFQPGNALEKVKRVVEGGLIECELTSAEPAAKEAKGETKPESEKRPVADDEKSEDKKDDGKKEEPTMKNPKTRRTTGRRRSRRRIPASSGSPRSRIPISRPARPGSSGNGSSRSTPGPRRWVRMSSSSSNRTAGRRS